MLDHYINREDYDRAYVSLWFISNDTCVSLLIRNNTTTYNHLLSGIIYQVENGVKKYFILYHMLCTNLTSNHLTTHSIYNLSLIVHIFHFSLKWFQKVMWKCLKVIRESWITQFFLRPNFSFINSSSHTAPLYRVEFNIFNFILSALLYFRDSRQKITLNRPGVNWKRSKK